jgi:hypothetical protein
MLPIFLAGFLFLVLLSVITFYGYRSYVRPSRVYDRVGGAQESTQDQSASAKQRMATVFEQIGKNITLSQAETTVTRRDLTMAGFRSDSSVAIFFGAKVMTALAARVIALLVREEARHSATIFPRCFWKNW